MFKQKSVFKKVLINNLLLALVPLILFVSVICYQFCLIYKNSAVHDAENYAHEYAERIRSEISSSISRSDYILKYNYLISNLNQTFQTTAQALKFTNNITTYLDNISGGVTQSVLIYCANDSVFENKYFYRLSRLENAREINAIFRERQTSFYSDNIIYTDEYGRKFFTFYRSMPLNNGSILSCRCYLPETSPSDYSMDIACVNDTIDKNFLMVPVNENFLVTVETDHAALNKAYSRYILFFLCLSLLLIAIIAFLAYNITGRITADVSSFINQLDEKNVFSIETSPADNDPSELVVIKKAIKELVTKVKAASDEKYRHILEKRRLELELLQRKIEPHLLYNSLAVVKLKAFHHGGSDIISIVDNLAAYYRTILNHGKEIVTVAEEMDMLKKYVIVNEMSHNKKYNLEISVPKELLDKQILHLFLQPFVENSIAHGLAGSRQNCKINISCTSEGAYLVFTVYDNGYGIPPNTLEKLNDLPHYTEGYGIKNVYQRLQLLCGDVSIHFESRQGSFTNVTIKVKDFEQQKNREGFEKN